MSNKLKWIPKDPDKTIGVPGKGYINPSDFSQEDLDNMIARAKNRKIDVNVFLINAGLKPAEPQLELNVDDSREFEKAEDAPTQEEVAESVEQKQKRTRRTKAEMEADKNNE